MLGLNVERERKGTIMPVFVLTVHTRLFPKNQRISLIIISTYRQPKGVMFRQGSGFSSGWDSGPRLEAKSGSNFGFVGAE